MSELEVRKVQQVGYSTLVVSLPRVWVKEVGLKQGDVVSLMREGDGTLRLLPGIAKDGSEHVKALIDADKCEGLDLMARIITGIYILGYDTIQIISRKGLSNEHLEEIRKTIQRLTGISIVEQTVNYTILQNFIDPTRFPVDGLLRRLYIITSSMQETAFRALKERRKELAMEAIHMENEVDRIYWLVVRQLLLAVKDRGVGKKIGVESARNIVGDRTIAKFLEVIGDYSETMAKEIYKVIDLKLMPDKEVMEDVYQFYELIKEIYDKTLKAFFGLDVRLANNVASMVDEASTKRDLLDTRIFMKIQQMPTEDRIGPTSLNSYLTVKSIVANLEQVSASCGSIAEMTINRQLETASDFLHFEKM